MTEVFSTGAWRPKAGDEATFVEAWTAFARWATEQPGVGTIRLTRDLHDDGRFVSFAGWESLEHMHSWKASDGFASRMRSLQEHVAEFTPAELELVTALTATAVSG
jgi:heme-degrading monooxygenase HmoA